MAARTERFSWKHPVIVLFVLIAVVASMSLAAEVLKPLALAVLLSFALAPAVRLLERLRLPRAAAVVLTVVLSLGAVSGLGYVVFRQVSSLADELPRNERKILDKIESMKPKGPGKFERVSKVVDDVANSLEQKPTAQPNVTDVRIVSQPRWNERLQSTVGPYLEFLGVGTFVLILVLFMLSNRENLGDRVIQLFGRRRITLTTRTMDEIGGRISRYLGTLTMVNSSYGLIVGLGLWAIGVPYAALWGVLAAFFRFIPYVGPAAAFALPLVYSVAHFEGWREPIEVAVLFGVIEVIANSFLEPIIYGKTTGVSALGLLVAAMFWTWLWGLLGLLLSTPMTVCLAVLGKYVPTLGFFGTLLGEESELDQDVRYYQRLLALDQDGADEIVEAALKQQPRVDVYDKIIVPTLARAERDFARDELDEREQAFVWRVVGDLLDDLKETPDYSLATRAVVDQEAKASPDGRKSPNGDGAAVGPAGNDPVRVVGIAANDTADALVLRMLADLLAPAGIEMTVLTSSDKTLSVMEAAAHHDPSAIVISHLPPKGMTPARYLIKRLRARFPSQALFVGNWGGRADAVAAAGTTAGRLSDVGATEVLYSLTEARDRLIQAVGRKEAAPVGQGAMPLG